MDPLLMRMVNGGLAVPCVGCSRPTFVLPWHLSLISAWQGRCPSCRVDEHEEKTVDLPSETMHQVVYGGRA